MRRSVPSCRQRAGDIEMLRVLSRRANGPCACAGRPRLDMAHFVMKVSVCVCVCVRALCVCACVRVRACVFVCVSVRARLGACLIALLHACRRTSIEHVIRVMKVCACVRMCARARVRACACLCVRARLLACLITMLHARRRISIEHVRQGNPCSLFRPPPYPFSFFLSTLFKHTIRAGGA